MQLPQIFTTCNFRLLTALKSMLEKVLLRAVRNVMLTRNQPELPKTKTPRHGGRQVSGGRCQQGN